MEKEYKILVLVGSRKGNTSNTLQFCRMSMEALRAQCSDTVIQTEILTANQWHVEACQSCNICFQEGRCVQEQRDGLGKIKEKLLRADCIIFASPVYAGTVSGDMKILIDRLSGWLHTMPLIGKTAVVLSTADSNHGDGAVLYMRQIIETMGAVVLCQKNVFIHYGPVRLGDLNGMKPVLQEIAEKMKFGMENPVKPTAAQEDYFKMQSRLYERFRQFGKKYPAFRIAEEQIWEQQGYFETASMAELIERKRKNYGKVLV